VKQNLLSLLVCQSCNGTYSLAADGQSLVCDGCEESIALHDGIPLFTEPAGEIVPIPKRERAPKIGTTWRRANWVFFTEQLEALPQDALVLDVGSGRGDFQELLAERNSISLDVYPYPECDIVCDLTKKQPFRPGSVDAIVLSNVLEHVFEPWALFQSFSEMLTSRGKLFVVVPFLLKVHQAPIDYLRYTHFALEKLAQEHDFELESLEGFYDPEALIGEGLRNVRWHVLRDVPPLRRYLARIVLSIQFFFNRMLGALLQGRRSSTPESERSPAPLGYQIVFVKK